MTWIWLTFCDDAHSGCRMFSMKPCRRCVLLEVFLCSFFLSHTLLRFRVHSDFCNVEYAAVVVILACLPFLYLTFHSSFSLSSAFKHTLFPKVNSYRLFFLSPYFFFFFFFLT